MSKATTGAFLDALRQPDVKIERPEMTMSARTNLRKLMTVLRAEIQANAATMNQAQRRRIIGLGKELEAWIFML